MANKNNYLNIALPVMLHNEAEIKAYLNAKRRIEERFSDREIYADVGVFVFLAPSFAMTPDARKAALENLRKYKLNIKHIELPITGENSLIHYGEEVKTFGIEGLLYLAAEHSERLADNSAGDLRPDVDVHTGVSVYAEIEEEHPFPGVYSVKGFLDNREKITERVREGFSRLEDFCKERGLRLLLENEPTANFEPAKNLGKNTLIYKPFGMPEIIKGIAKNTTFDIGAWAMSRDVPHRLRINSVDPSDFLGLMGVSSVEEYEDKIMDINSYFDERTRVLHLSNVQGIGAHLTEAEDIRRWGEEGTNDGILSGDEIRGVVEKGIEKGLVQVIEVNYDLKNIPKNEFREADNFLKYALKKIL